MSQRDRERVKRREIAEIVSKATDDELIYFTNLRNQVEFFKQDLRTHARCSTSAPTAQIEAFG